MNQTELLSLLDGLLATWENEVVEFKQAGNDYKTDKIGEYFSALANEANLRGKEKSWLVFGVNNKSRIVCGSDYRPEPDYDLSDPLAVKMTVYGSVVDPAYSQLLIQKTDLPLDEIPALDRVQKRLPLKSKKPSWELTK